MKKTKLEMAQPPKIKKTYKKPNIRSEKMMAFGALCNGMGGGGRKASSGAPDFCQASKLLS